MSGSITAQYQGDGKTARTMDVKEMNKEFGLLVKKARKEMGLTLRDLSDALENSVEYTSIYRLEQGGRDPRLSEAIELDSYLGLGFVEFVKRWGAGSYVPPEEVQIRGVKYRIDRQS